MVYAVPAGRGLAEARNEALAATTSGVLAFIDDDVAVCEGWLGAMHDAWRTAPEDRGCIGGPIGVRFTGPRPAWLTDALLGVLGVASGGDSFHGGNVSFRADALRGIQGFWPMRGRPELHDWFSEEHHAQRELAATGWTAAAAPLAAAERIVDPAQIGRWTVLARRARYGARSALIGERRRRAVAARVAATSAAGVALAVARRREAAATERAARAAENVGTLLAPLIAHRELQPTAAHTPFRHSVAPPQRLLPDPLRVLRRSGAVVLLYHRVDDGAGSGVSPANFASQIDVLRSTRTPAPLEAIVSGDAPSNAFAVTFDDGYAETMRRTLPVLADAGVPATVFISTAHVGTQRAFWWERVSSLLRRGTRRPLKLTIEDETRAWADARSAQLHVIGWLQPKAPEVIDATLTELAAWAGEDLAVAEHERPLSVQELRELASSPLIAIDAHTRTHPNLRLIDHARRMEELVGSREDLARWLAIDPPAGLAYPYGTPGADVDLSTRAAAKAAGFRYAVLTASGTVTAATDRYALPRLAPADISGDDFAALIARAARPRRG